MRMRVTFLHLFVMPCVKQYFIYTWCPMSVLDLLLLTNGSIQTLCTKAQAAAAAAAAKSLSTASNIHPLHVST